MASLRNKPKAAPPKIEPSAPNQSEADQEGLEAIEPQPELAATVELLQGQIAALRGAETRHGEPDKVITGKDRRRDWLNSNPLAQQNLAALNSIHRDALGAGLVDTSPSYFDFMDARLAALAAKTPAAAASEIVKDIEDRTVKTHAREQRQQEAAPDISPRFVSAPVSRQVAGTSGARRGSINLSPAQREAAKFSGVSEIEYAKQLERLEELRDSGALQR
jgi:phage I-like protein